MNVQMSKLPSRYNSALLAEIAKMKELKPKWGYRRIAAWFHRLGIKVPTHRVRVYLRALVP